MCARSNMWGVGGAERTVILKKMNGGFTQSVYFSVCQIFEWLRYLKQTSKARVNSCVY
jgi:hypothetical protein